MAWELVLAIAASSVEPAPERAAMRAPLWRGVREVTLACEVDPDAGLPAGLCAAALAEARRDAPYPVRPADGSGGIATLALRLTAGMRDGRAAVTLTGERAAAIDESQGALVPRTTRADPGEPPERTIARALDRVLPWRQERRAARSHRRH